MKSLSLPLLAGSICLAIVLLSSCQKDPSDIVPETKDSCRLVKMTFSEGPGITIGDTAHFIYENGRIVRVNYDDYYTTLQYNGDRVIRVNYHENGSTEVDAYNAIVYHSSGRIDSVIEYYVDPGAPDEAVFGHAFFYNADGMPRRIEQLWMGSLNGGSGASVGSSSDYTYAQQNITQREFYIGLPTNWIVNFTYDNKENYFKKLPAELIFADDLYFGASAVHFLQFAHHLFTKNNIISNDGVPVHYKTDSRGNIIEYNYEGNFRATFTYDCP